MGVRGFGFRTVRVVDVGLTRLLSSGAQDFHHVKRGKVEKICIPHTSLTDKYSSMTKTLS